MWHTSLTVVSVVTFAPLCIDNSLFAPPFAPSRMHNILFAPHPCFPQMWYSVADVVEAWDNLVAVAAEAGECKTTTGRAAGHGGQAQEGEEEEGTQTRGTASSNNCSTTECQQTKNRKFTSGNSRNRLEGDMHRSQQYEISRAVVGTQSHGGSEGPGSRRHDRRMNDLRFLHQELHQRGTDYEEDNTDITKREIVIVVEEGRVDPDEEEEGAVKMMEDNEVLLARNRITEVGKIERGSEGLETLDEFMATDLMMPEIQDLQMFGEPSDENWKPATPARGEGGRERGGSGQQPVTCQATFRHDLVDVTRQMLQVGQLMFVDKGNFLTVQKTW